MFWQLMTVPLLIAANAYFVAAEYTLVAIRSTQIGMLRKRGYRGTAAAMQELKSSPAGAIGAIQVCITLTNLMLGWIGEPAMSALLNRIFGSILGYLPPSLFEAVSIILSFGAVTLLTVVFSELLPKAVTLTFVLPMAVLTAIPILRIRQIVAPLVWLMNKMANCVSVPLRLGRIEDLEAQGHTADEIRAITVEAAASGVLTEQERFLVLNSLALGRRTARQIMVPRLRVRYLDLKKSMALNRAVMEKELYTRFPLCDGGLDHVVGIVRTQEFLFAHNEAADSSVLALLAQPAVYAPETIGVDKLLALFQREKAELILLVDEYGAVQGMVTLQDVVDELVAPTPCSKESSGEHSAPVGTMEVSGGQPVHELALQLGLEGWASDCTAVTIGGLIVEKVGYVPRSGFQLDVDGVRLAVMDADTHLIRRVRISSISAGTREQ